MYKIAKLITFALCANFLNFQENPRYIGRYISISSNSAGLAWKVTVWLLLFCQEKVYQFSLMDLIPLC